MAAPLALADPEPFLDGLADDVIGPRASPAPDGIEEMRDRQRSLYACVFDEPYNDETDGVLFMTRPPAIGQFTICHQGNKSCVFEIIQYRAYDRAGLVSLVAQQDPILAAELDAHLALSVGWAEGLLLSDRGGVATAALVVCRPDAGGVPSYAALPLSPEDRDRFLPIGFSGTIASEEEDASGEFPSRPEPITDSGMIASQDCSSLEDAGQCAEYAACECGTEPDCEPEAIFSGMWECMRAADCRDAKCDWAHCIEGHEDVCEHWHQFYATHESLSCAAIHILELTLCVPVEAAKAVMYGTEMGTGKTP